MDLQGQTVSHYRVLHKLGGGGMGVVYEAEDLRLRRHVALKFLPESLAHDQDALQRFLREARAASSLNHPNICTIHEVEEHEGQPVIVMELMQGSTLKQRLAEGPLPVDKVMELGIEICSGLEAAHAQGIIHRDIKPANVFLTSLGTAKILDFGLAKLLPEARLNRDDGAAEEESDLSLTFPGVIHGTTCYMSPEQARGEELDRRTDLFSLGAVLYEMATGQRAFIKKNVILTLDAILNGSPTPVSKLNSAIPPEFEAIVGKALEKRREERYQSAAQMAAALRETMAAKVPFTTVAPQVPDYSPSSKHGFTSNWKLIVPAVMTLALALAGAGVLRSRRASALSDKDTIVLADFENRTGDSVFDETLKQALAVDLGQSPFLNILSDRRIAATLLQMGRSPEQPVSGEVARELCQRVDGKAMLQGFISSLGSDYVISLNAINCASGDAFVKEQAEARGKENVLKELGRLASDMRAKLGESLASMQKFATPIEEATTPSLEALKAYSMARRAVSQNGDAAALPLYQRAVELDSKFALAYRSMATSYNNLGQATAAMENSKKAFDLRERVSEHERYAIEAYYYSIGLGDAEKGNQVYEIWKQSFPRDFLPLGNLGDAYMRLGQWEKGLQNTEEALRLDPNFVLMYSNLAWMQLALSRSEAARATIDEALARKLDSFLLRLALYEAAFLKGDQQTMQQQLAWAAGRPREEDWLLSTQSDTEAYLGKLAKAGEFSQRAVDSALRSGSKETAALWRANAAMREAEFGVAAARENAMGALALMAGRDVRTMAALALARAGDVARAQHEADALGQEFPEDTLIQNYWLPAIRSAIEINSKDPAKAIRVLEPAEPYELGQSQPFQVGMMYPAYLRGEAYLLARQGKEAVAEFQKIVDHRGIILNFPLGSLARLGLARAYLLQGDRTKARAAYEEFLGLWKDADPDIPVLRQAMAEYAKLK